MQGIEGVQTNFNNYNLTSESFESKKDNNVQFSQILRKNINNVNNLQKDADKLTEKFVMGETDNIHQVTIATEKARLALDLTTTIQSEVVDAYEEIMRIQV